MSNHNPDLRPQTAVQAIEGMTLTHNPDETRNMDATIQFHLSGNNGGDYYLTLANDACKFSVGEVSDPTLTITSPAEIWLKIARKEMNGSVAYMTGKYKASGKVGMLLKMDTIFSRKPSENEITEKTWLKS